MVTRRLTANPRSNAVEEKIVRSKVGVEEEENGICLPDEGSLLADEECKAGGDRDNGGAAW